MGKGVKGVLGAAIGIGSLYFGAGGFTNLFFKSLGLMAIGQATTPGQEGPRLNNLGVNVDSEGAEIPRGWGTWRQGVRLVWSPGLVEHKDKKRGGKGGPSYTEYTYSVKTSNIGGRFNITRLKRIKLNQIPIYDWNGGNELGAVLVFADGHWSGKTKNGIVIRVTPGSLTQPVDEAIEADKGVDEWTNYPRMWTITLEIPKLTKFNNAVPNVTVEAYYNVIDLPSIIEEVGSWVDLEPEDFDLTELIGMTVAPTEGEGFVIESRRQASAVLAELMDTYFFSLPEVDGVLRARRRTSASVATLTTKNLRMHTADTSTPDTSFIQADEDDLPEIMEGVFRDVGREHQTGYRYARRNQMFDNGGTKRKETFTMSSSMKGARAHQIVQIRLGEKWAAAKKLSLAWGLEYLWLSAGDNIKVENPVPDVNGAQPLIDVYLPQITSPLFGALSSTAPFLDRPLYSLPLGPESTDLGRNSPVDSGEPVLFAAECPIPEPNEPCWNRASFVCAVAPATGDEWDSAFVRVEAQKLGETEWKKISDFNRSDTAVIGELTATYVPSPVGIGFDATGTISCKAYGGGFDSTELELAQGGANMILFETGLACIFTTAAPGVDDFYTLSNVWNGVYGSDDFLGVELPAGTRFVLLTDSDGDFSAGVKWVYADRLDAVKGEVSRNFDDQGANARFGSSLRVRSRTTESDPPEWAETNMGVFIGQNLMPPSPTLFEATRTSGGDLRLRGIGRGRDWRTNSESDIRRVRLDEPQYAGAYRYLIVLEADGQQFTFTKTTTAALGDFDWTLTDSELTTLFGSSPTEIKGTIALYGRSGPGRPAYFVEQAE